MGRSKDKQVVPPQASILDAPLATMSAVATTLCPTPLVSMNTTLYKRFVLLVNNSNQVKNLNKQACKEDLDYLSVVSSDE